jgi:hypothetical protein
LTETIERQDELAELDVNDLIATRVMGWKRHGDVWRDKHGVVMAQVATEANAGMVGGIFRPQSDDTSAFRVVDTFKPPRWIFRLEHGVFMDKSWTATFICDRPVLAATASAPTRPLAICRAAYKAVQMRAQESR